MDYNGQYFHLIVANSTGRNADSIRNSNNIIKINNNNSSSGNNGVLLNTLLAEFVST
jgi:hypothetical protein